MSATVFGWLILLFPLAGSILIGLGHRRWPGRAAGWIGTASIALAFAAALGAFLTLLGEPAEERQLTSTAWDYATSVGLDIQLGILVDPLSVVMCLIVTGVSTLIHLYSTAYMVSDRGYARFFSYLNFFVFSMLLLVLAGNFVLLIVGWAFVGFASYALISFWYRRGTATAAGMKAFVINVIGDIGLVLAAFLIFREVGAFDYLTVFEESREHFETNEGSIVAICLLLLVGAFAKSAQIPFHTWLPDAMEGPTPVSALIHAATMVTAGVYLICRTHPVFEAAPDVQALAAILGLVTLLVAGVVALVQWDIKRVIAYSTMSQIGYMFVGAGVGAYGFAMFHLVTHAFFKALLFLAAGIVIHHLAGEQDIRKMGGLRKALPTTNLTFLVGTLALVGIPPLAGFWSKDAILASALDGGGVLGWTLYVGGLIGAFLTGLYSLRLYLRVFHGDSSVEHAAAHDTHHGEGPRSMVLPVLVLAAGSVVVGLLNIPGVWHPFEDWLEPVAESLTHPSTGEEWLTSLLAVGVGALGALLAWRAFRAGRELVPDGSVRRTLEHKLWFDELYDAAFSRPAQAIAVGLRERFEEPIVRGGLDEVAEGTLRGASVTSSAQTGLLRTYALAITVSVAVLALVFLVVR